MLTNKLLMSSGGGGNNIKSFYATHIVNCKGLYVADAEWLGALGSSFGDPQGTITNIQTGDNTFEAGGIRCEIGVCTGFEDGLIIFKADAPLKDNLRLYWIQLDTKEQFDAPILSFEELGVENCYRSVFSYGSAFIHRIPVGKDTEIYLGAEPPNWPYVEVRLSLYRDSKTNLNKTYSITYQALDTIETVTLEAGVERVEITARIPPDTVDWYFYDPVGASINDVEVRIFGYAFTGNLVDNKIQIQVQGRMYFDAEVMFP